MTDSKVSFWHKVRNFFNGPIDSSTSRVTNDSNDPNQQSRVFKISDFSKVLDPKDIVLDVKAASKNELLKYLANLVSNSNTTVNTEEIYGKYLVREKNCPTDLGSGIALPHLQVESITKLTMLVVKLQRSIKWSKSESVDIVISFLVPETDKNYQYIPYLASVARLLLRPSFVQSLRQTKNKFAIVKLFK